MRAMHFACSVVIASFMHLRGKVVAKGRDWERHNPGSNDVCRERYSTKNLPVNDSITLHGSAGIPARVGEGRKLVLLRLYF